MREAVKKVLTSIKDVVLVLVFVQLLPTLFSYGAHWAVERIRDGVGNVVGDWATWGSPGVAVSLVVGVVFFLWTGSDT